MILCRKDENAVNRRKRSLLQKTAGRMQSALREFSEHLKGQPITPELIFGQVEGRFPRSQHRRLQEWCGHVQRGIAGGIRDCARFSALSTEGLEEAVHGALAENLASLPAEQRHQYLILLMQLLFQESSQRIDSDVAIYLSNLHHQELEAYACQLLVRKADAELSEAAALSVADGRSLWDAGILTDLNQYRAEERGILLSAAMETALLSHPNAISPDLTPVQLGWQAGFAACAWDNVRDELMLHDTPFLPDTLHPLAAGAVITFLHQLSALSSLVPLVYGHWEDSSCQYLFLPDGLFCPILALLCEFRRSVSSLPEFMKEDAESAGDDQQLRRFFVDLKIHASTYASHRLSDWELMEAEQTQRKHIFDNSTLVPEGTMEENQFFLESEVEDWSESDS